MTSKPKEEYALVKIEENSEDEKVDSSQISSISPIKVYNFNTSWCKYSVMFAPEWSKFESMVEKDSLIEAIDVKCDDDENNSLCKEFDVPGFPSVVIMNGDKRINYEGARNAEALLEFVKSL